MNAFEILSDLLRKAIRHHGGPLTKAEATYSLDFTGGDLIALRAALHAAEDGPFSDAPKLLDACRALLNTCATNLEDQEPADLEVYAAARAVIAKATGESAAPADAPEPFGGSHAPDCTYRQGHGAECNCWRSDPKQNPEAAD